MIPLASRLDDMDFDALVEIGRGLLPGLTRARDGGQIWDDYNYHDPGIMLVELLAFIADTQIYAIGRDRRDERIAMAALFGASPQGAIPASGTLYPLGDAASAYRVEKSTRVTPTQTPAPRLEVLHDVDVLPVQLTRLTCEAAGEAVDLTAANAQARASFDPFGNPPIPGARLRITLEGALPGGAAWLSLGIELEDGSDEAPLGPEEPELGVIDAYYGADRQPLKCPCDTSRAMRRSGVMLFALPAADDRQAMPPAVHEIVLRPRKGGVHMPRLLRIAPNALPVVQRATFLKDDFRGTGRAGQSVAIEPPGLFGEDEAASGWTWRLTGPDALTVKTGDDATMPPWKQLALSAAGRSLGGQDFAAAGSSDRVFSRAERSDGGRIDVRFGNGVNGRKPPRDATIAVTLELSAGRGGTIEAPLHWLLDGHRTRWENRQAIGGGGDAQSVDDMLAGLRSRLGRERTLVASRHLAEAAKALPAAFGIVRAEVEEGWERGRTAPSVAATRSLVVTRGPGGGETQEWREAIARVLRRRLPIGERLLVVSPVYRGFRIGVRATTRGGEAPAVVAAAIARDLADRLTPTGGNGGSWPLGRDVDATTVGGWIRRVAGVGGVEAVRLLDAAGRPLAEEGRLGVRRGELPRLLVEPGDIVVAAGAGR